VIELLEYERETWKLLVEKLAKERANVDPLASDASEKNIAGTLSVQA
jgi:hypothetical protein